MRYKHFISLTTIILLFSIATNAQINENYREKIAQNFIQSSFYAPIRSAKLILKPTAITDITDTLAYVYQLKPKGYLIMSTKKGINPIIAFSTETNFDFTPHPNNILLDLLKKDMKQRIAFYKKSISNPNAANIRKNRELWNQLANTNTTKGFDTQYGPLLSSVWGGVNCVDDFWNPIYVGNYYTPNHYSPGCVATATSIVMHYYKWPLQGVGYHTDYDNSGNSKGAYYANFGATTYQWWRMANEYYNKKTKEIYREAMGKLAYHCAIAFDMNFEYGGSTSNLNRTPLALDKYFRYSSHYESSTWYSFWPRLRENLRNSQPVTMAISKTNGEGHAMVCDGYGQNSGQPKYYHLQFGWWGSYNGWYDIQGSWDGSGYTIIDGAVFDILPDPAVGAPIRTADEFDFTVPILVSDSLHWESFKIWESYNGGSYVLKESNFVGLNYKPNISKSGNYKYKVQAKVNGSYYANSTSLPQEVLVKRKDSALISLDFDGDDSFFIKDNYFNDLDISDSYTIEAWLKVNKLNPNSNYDVIMDRRTVFSWYLISDNDADYAIRFVTRNGSDAITASLRSDSSKVNLSFGEWIHIAISRNNDTTSFFINGEEVDYSTDPHFSLRYSVKALNIGARYWGNYSRYLIGEMDEIRISDTARYYHGETFSPYRCMPFINDTSTLLLLHLDENSGSSIGDESRHFFNTNLRSSPNYANWVKENAPKSISYQERLTATNMQVNIGRSVQLHWSTSYEKNIESFEIQRSNDKNVWTTIGEVKGQSNSNTTTEYEFTDQTAPLGKSFYRLKQIEPKCRYAYSNTDSLFISPKEQLYLYPNPANNTLYIDGLEGHQVVNLRVYNIQGKEVFYSTSNANKLDISQLAGGLYIIRIELTDRVSIKKFMIARTK